MIGAQTAPIGRSRWWFWGSGQVNTYLRFDAAGTGRGAERRSRQIRRSPRRTGLDAAAGSQAGDAAAWPVAGPASARPEGRRRGGGDRRGRAADAAAGGGQLCEPRHRARGSQGAGGRPAQGDGRHRADADRPVHGRSAGHRVSRLPDRPGAMRTGAAAGQRRRRTCAEDRIPERRQHPDCRFCLRCS